LLVLLYGVGVVALRPRLAPGVALPRRQALRFLLGLGLFYGAVASPLDTLAEQFLLSAHMVQHLLLMYPVPLLLLTGLPAWLLRPWLTTPCIAPVVRCLSRPLVACAAFTVPLAVWHVPALYEWALRDRTVHNIAHLSFLGTALLLWWPIVSPLAQFPRLPLGSQVLYLFASSIGQLPVFAYVTFSSTVLYPTYEMAPRLVPLTPLQDQQLGGILMHVTSMIVLCVALAMVFKQWSHTESTDRKSKRLFAPTDRTAFAPRLCHRLPLARRQRPPLARSRAWRGHVPPGQAAQEGDESASAVYRERRPR
jgi:putative membrane protein